MTKKLAEKLAKDSLQSTRKNKKKKLKPVKPVIFDVSTN